jgi:hypothetical protein
LSDSWNLIFLFYSADGNAQTISELEVKLDKGTELHKSALIDRENLVSELQEWRNRCDIAESATCDLQDQLVCLRRRLGDQSNYLAATTSVMDTDGTLLVKGIHRLAATLRRREQQHKKGPFVFHPHPSDESKAWVRVESDTMKESKLSNVPWHMRPFAKKLAPEVLARKKKLLEVKNAMI